MRTMGGHYARYEGRLYKAEPTSPVGRVLLVAEGDSPPDPEFRSPRPGLWMKTVPRGAVTEFYRIKYKWFYRGLDCSVSRTDDDGRFEILYLIGDTYAAADAGMTEIDRGVFQAWVDRSELDDFHEVRRDL